MRHLIVPKEAALKTGSIRKLMCAVVITVGVGAAWGQIADSLPLTVTLPVTFYDFKATGTNPDFEPSAYAEANGGLKQKMVTSQLGTNLKPVLLSNLVFNSHVAEWFVPSSASGSEFSLNPTTGRYEWSNLLQTGVNQYRGQGADWATNPMTNYVIYDDLTFTLYDSLYNTDARFMDAALLGKGIYVYDNQEFFPIDGKGFGAEPAGYPDYGWTNAAGHNYSFTMEIHKEITYHPDLFFTFTGDDDVWAYINRSLVMDLGGIHSALTDTLDLGTLGLMDGEIFHFDFFYAERHVIGSHILIMTNLVAPPLIDTIGITATPPGDMCAGDTKTLTATITNTQGQDVTTEFGQYTTWTVSAIDDALGTSLGDSRLVTTTGPTVQFEAHKAFTDYTVTATITNPDDPNNTETNALTFRVNACYPACTVIEPNQNPDKWTSAHKSQMIITAGSNTGALYAFVRDADDNLVGEATQATWTSRNKSVVTVAPQAGNQAVGVVTRVANTEMSTWVVAIDARTATCYDSVQVSVVPWYPVRLKLVNGNDTAQDLSGGVVITTDIDQPLVVKGLQSNSDTLAGQYIWTVVEANWLLSTTDISLSVPTPATPSSQWHMSPTAPGTGTLHLTHVDSRTAPLAVPVTVNPGAINRISVTLTDTATIRPTAGLPVKANVCIYGTDGSYPKDTCLQVTFADLLAGSVPGHPATWSYGGATGDLTSPALVCFTGGCAEVSFLLYYAPEDKSPHNLVVTQVANPTVTSPSGPFVLSPGALARLVLEYPVPGHLAIPDTVIMSFPDGVLNMISVGYDAYGNVRGSEYSNWTAGGNLHQPSAATNVSRQFYDASMVIENEKGLFSAAAASNPAITDGVWIFITGRGIALDTAYTRDLNGNGYLDVIELHFNKAVLLPRSGQYDTGFTVTDLPTNTRFPTDSLVSMSGQTSDNVWLLYLTEQKTALPQTSWLPYVTVSTIPGVAPIPGATAFPATDGAGPVIWRVEKHVVNSTNRTEDSILVFFSETVYGLNGSPVTTSYLPSNLFNVYRKNVSTGSYEEVGNLLDGIPGLLDVREGSFGTVVKFGMANGNDLLTTYVVNIDSMTSRIQDDPSLGNMPLLDNQKVPIRQFGNIGKVLPGPNPTQPIFTRIPAGAFFGRHEPDARRWVHDDNKGTVLSFSLTVPPDDNDPLSDIDKIAVYIKIYDVAGNLVQSTEFLDLAEQLRQLYPDKDNVPVDLYWNGSNSKGMAVSPGLYHLVIYIDYKDDINYTDLKDYVRIGIGH